MRAGTVVQTVQMLPGGLHFGQGQRMGPTEPPARPEKSVCLRFIGVVIAEKEWGCFDIRGK